MNLMTERQGEWNKAYLGGGNICFYPHEEVVRFINKYVRKREGISTFKNVLEISSTEWDTFTSLDLGCGMGRHVKFLDEFGLNPYGIDLSSEAISMGKDWMRAIGKAELAEHLIVGSVMDLPFEDNYFEVCISCQALDSMPRETAQKGMQEAYRVLKTNGLMYLDLIMDSNRGDKEEVVNDGYEKDTIQSYFTVDTIKDFIGTEAEIIEFKIIKETDDVENEIGKRAHLIIKKGSMQNG